MPSKFDHLGVPLPKDQFEAIVQWYLTALAPLNYAEVMRFPGVVGLGVDGNPDLWFQAKDDYTEGSKLHIAFHAPDHATIDAFHKAAIDAGGKCNGPPGLRAQYHPNYYGAFVLDPIGNNVEVVDHCPHPEGQNK